MPFRLIRGTFHVQGYAPDGDSIRFMAVDPARWQGLDGPKVKLNSKGHAQLRFEGIDTLETHYEGRHQPLFLADRATEFLLECLGIANVQWNVARTRVTRADDATPGFVLTRAAEKYGRPVAFVFAGRPPGPDGSSVHLDGRLLRRSVNFQSLLTGMAYPTYYQGLFYDLRDALTAAVQKARKRRIGLWRFDRTTRGFPAADLAALTGSVVIFPKLFRRLVVFLAGGGALSDFKSYLASHPDPLLLLDRCHFTHLDTLVEVRGQRVRLTAPPERLVFLP